MEALAAREAVNTSSWPFQFLRFYGGTKVGKARWGKQGVQIGREREQEAELGRQGVGRGEERTQGNRKEREDREV